MDSTGAANQSWSTGVTGGYPNPGYVTGGIGVHDPVVVKRPLVVESRNSDNFNAIDRNLIVGDQGRWWLNFGSFWSGVELIQLDPNTGLRSGAVMTGIAYNSAIEAPFIVKRGAYCYQYVSFGFCCRGAQSTYRVVVGRSTSVTGPYVDRNGRAMTSGGGTEILAQAGPAANQNRSAGSLRTGSGSCGRSTASSRARRPFAALGLRLGGEEHPPVHLLTPSREGGGVGRGRRAGRRVRWAEREQR